MAVAFRAIDSNSDIAGPTVTGNKPTGTVDQDVLYAFITLAGSATTITGVPTGWTLLRADPNPADFSTLVYWKIASSEPASWDWTLSANDIWRIDVIAYSGADQTQPTDVSGSSITPSGLPDTVITTATITPSVNNCMILCYFGVDASGAARTWTQNGAMTERVDSLLQSFHVAIAEELQVTAAAIDRNGTVSGTIQDLASHIIAIRGPTAAHVVKQGKWRFYENHVADPTNALAAENTAPTLTGIQIQREIIRLRLQLNEVGAIAGSGTIELEFGESGSDWGVIADIVDINGQEGKWLQWADGQGVVGNTLGANRLTGTTASGKFHEAPALSESVGASAKVEIDCAILIKWPPPSTAIKLQVKYNGVPVALDTGSTVITLNTCTPAERPYTVDRMAPDGVGQARELDYSQHSNMFFDGLYWWLFTLQPNTPTNLAYYRWSGSGAWGAIQTIAMTGAAKRRHSYAFKIIDNTPVVFCFWNSPTGNVRYRRATIASGTLTWAAEQDYGVATYGNVAHTCIDDGNYHWIGGINGTTGIWAARATNVDTGSAWTAGFNVRKTLADAGVVDGDIFAMIGLESDKALCVWHNGTALKWATVTDAGGFSAVTTLVATAHAADWGLCKSGDYVYLVHTDSTGLGGNWVLRVYDIIANTWTLGPAPGITGQNSNDDGISVIPHGDHIYAFGTDVGTEGGQDRPIQYKRYVGPGITGSWGLKQTVTPVGGRGNSDDLTGAAIAADNKVVVASLHSDSGVNATGYAIEVHYVNLLDHSGPHGPADFDPYVANIGPF